MALLGEMYYKPNGPDSWFNLPRNEGVAYAAQESWVLNETVRVSIAKVSSPEPKADVTTDQYRIWPTI